MSRILYICSAILITFSGVAHGLSHTPPGVSAYEHQLLIERVAIKGAKRFTAEQLQDVVTQKKGEKIDIKGVQYDLRAIAALYKDTNVSEDVEAWSGFELITSQVTVTPFFARHADGLVTVTYNVKEWFPTRN